MITLSQSIPSTLQGRCHFRSTHLLAHPHGLLSFPHALLLSGPLHLNRFLLQLSLLTGLFSSLHGFLLFLVELLDAQQVGTSLEGVSVVGRGTGEGDAGVEEALLGGVARGEGLLEEEGFQAEGVVDVGDGGGARGVNFQGGQERG